MLDPVELGPRDGGTPEPAPGGVAWRAWFEIPTDLVEATVRALARPTDRRAGLAEEFGDSVEVEAHLDFGVAD